MTIAEDRLIGVKQIADFLGLPRRNVLYRLGLNQIPHTRVGRHYMASKRVLTEQWLKECGAQAHREAA